MRPEMRVIADRVTEYRLDWREVMQANEQGWQIDGKTVHLTDWELEILKKVTGL
jgi:hypothetical protein